MPQNRWRRWGSLNAPPNPPVATLGALPLELGRYAPSGASCPRVIDPLAVVISLCGWLMTPYGWLAGWPRLTAAYWLLGLTSTVQR